jgi:hypothetical protein
MEYGGYAAERVTGFDEAVRKLIFYEFKDDGFVKSSQARRANPQGVWRTFGYAATTKDAAQRSMRAFYEVVKDNETEK